MTLDNKVTAGDKTVKHRCVPDQSTSFHNSDIVLGGSVATTGMPVRNTIYLPTIDTSHVR